MIIANLLGRTKVALMSSAEVTAWQSASPADSDLVYNLDTRTFFCSSSGSTYDIGGPVTVHKIDDTAPASGSYVTYAETINKTILLFALNGQMYRVVSGTATATNEVFHNSLTGQFELYIGATPAVQFNSEWLCIIYSDEQPGV